MEKVEPILAANGGELKIPNMYGSEKTDAEEFYRQKRYTGERFFKAKNAEKALLASLEKLVALYGSSDPFSRLLIYF